MTDILVSVRAYVSDIIGGRFEKLRNGHKFEILDVDLRSFKKRHRSDVQMSVA